MPNQASPDTRRVTFVVDKAMYDGLETLARTANMSVGELIRRGLEKQYAVEEVRPVPQIRVALRARAKMRQSPSAKQKKKPKPKK